MCKREQARLSRLFSFTQVVLKIGKRDSGRAGEREPELGGKTGEAGETTGEEGESRWEKAENSTEECEDDAFYAVTHDTGTQAGFDDEEDEFDDGI